jgi:hypothetical protein
LPQNPRNIQLSLLLSSCQLIIINVCRHGSSIVIIINQAQSQNKSAFFAYLTLCVIHLGIVTLYTIRTAQSTQ